MKKILFLIIISLFALNAQAAEMKIGYVDLNKALNESNEGKKAKEKLQNLVKSSEEIIEEKRIEIKELEQEIIKQASILNPEAIKEKQDQREKLIKALKRMIKDSQEEVEKKQADFMREIIGDISKAVSAIGKEEGYSLILEKNQGGIIYIPADLDLTGKVIEKFNKATKEDNKE